MGIFDPIKPYIMRPDYRALLVFDSSRTAKANFWNCVGQFEDAIERVEITRQRIVFKSGARIWFSVIHKPEDVFNWAGIGFHYINARCLTSVLAKGFLRSLCRSSDHRIPPRFVDDWRDEE